MRINIQVNGVQDIERHFDKIVKTMDDLTRPFDEITKDWMKKFDSNFPATGGILKQSWPERKYKYAWPILQKTGKLRRSFSREVNKRDASIENKVEYAKYHQFGTPRLPIRRIIDVTDDMGTFAQKVINDYIGNVINN